MEEIPKWKKHVGYSAVFIAVLVGLDYLWGLLDVFPLLTFQNKLVFMLGAFVIITAVGVMGKKWQEKRNTPVAVVKKGLEETKGK